MRIAMIDPSLFTLPYDRALSMALGHVGHDVTLFGRKPGPDDGDPTGVRLVEAFYKLAGSPSVAALPRQVRLAVKGLDHVWSMARLIPRLRRLRPDVIHFQWLPLPLVDRRMLSTLRRIAPLVLTVHDTNPFNGDPSSKMQVRGFPESLAKFDRLFVHTEQGKARLCAQGLPADRFTLVPHGASDTPSECPPDPLRGEITFVLFGKIKPYKGADILIEAFAALPERLRGQARLRIVGKPYIDLAPLHALVRDRGLQARVTIEPNFVAEAEIPSVLAPGCVAVFPYREIDTSAVLFQALALGRPIVASRLGTFEEMLGGGTGGLLVASEDVAGFTAALARMIDDRDFAARCSREAWALSRNAVSWETVAERSEAGYALAEAAWEKPDGVSRATDVSRRMRKITGGNC